MKVSLLPPTSTELERALELSLAKGVTLDVPAHKLWAPYHCPSDLLSWLAWAVGVDEWASAWSEDVKRQVIAAMPEIRRHRGTVWAVKAALKAAGYGDSELIEGVPAVTYNGEKLYDATDTYNGNTRWSHFRVITELDDRAVLHEEIQRARRLILLAKNVRSVLHDLMFRLTTITDIVDAPVDAAVINMSMQQFTDHYAFGVRYDARVMHSGAVLYNGQCDAVALHIDTTYRYNGRQQYAGSARYAGQACVTSFM